MHHRHVLEQDVSIVHITGGTGSARTELTAFDAALAEAGIHNANLIRVSSITPPETTVEASSARTVESAITPGEFVPAVYARSQSNVPGERITAAVAGVSLREGYGVNVEHHAVNSDTATVEAICRQKLEELVAIRDTTMKSDPWVHCVETTVPQTPAAQEWTCAVAAIVYR